MKKQESKFRNDLIFELAMEGINEKELAVLFGLPYESITRIVDTMWNIHYSNRELPQ